MEDIEQIKEVIKTITKTIGGHDVRNLTINNDIQITGEIKFPSEIEWNTKDAVWNLKGKWAGKNGYKWFDLKIDILQPLKDKLKKIKQTTGGYKVSRLKPFMLGERLCITGNVKCIKTGVWQHGEVWDADGSFTGNMFWTELNSEEEINTGQFNIVII
jgi:hypothetical protein